MFTTVAAMVLVAGQPAQTVDVVGAPGTVTGSFEPPLSYLQMFPAHVWCVAQKEAAEAFFAKCGRELAGLQEPAQRDQRARWKDLQFQARVSLVQWTLLAEVQQAPANSLEEHHRRALLGLLLEHLGKEDFFAGRLPPPVPDEAPRE
jgi:hypothetical protein